MVANDPTSARNLYGAAAAAGLMGIVTCCLSSLGQFFFLACPAAMVIGAATLVNLFQKPEMRQELGAGFFAVIAGAIAGIVFGGLGLLIGAVMIGMR